MPCLRFRENRAGSRHTIASWRGVFNKPWRCVTNGLEKGLAGRARKCQRNASPRGTVHRTGRGGAMHFISPGGTPRYPTREEVRHDEAELAEAILHGVVGRPEQAFGNYFVGRRASCALRAAYDGMYLLPREDGGVSPTVESTSLAEGRPSRP